MKIAVAQIKPVKGDVLSNITGHNRLIDLALASQADMIIFPELSLTGYEPSLAKSLAIYPDDEQLTIFQEISDAKKIIIGAGMPTKTNDGICISLLLFQPGTERRVYSKKYLHVDEEPYFVSGENFPVLTLDTTIISFAICYELSVPDHAKAASENGAQVYIASVAKTANGVENAYERLSDIAKKYSIPVLMCNCIGPNDNFTGAGNSAAWNSDGGLLCQLDDRQQGLVIMDVKNQKAATIG